MYERHMSGSVATLSPICFIVTNARAPEYAAPAATSRATFSLVDHCTLTPGAFSRTRVSMISVEGVPG